MQAFSDTPFVLIGGCPRSGTTPLMMYLNGDPRVFISGEENILRICGQLQDLLGTQERLKKKAAKTTQGMRELSVRENLSLQEIHSYNLSTSQLPGVLVDIYSRQHGALKRGSPLCLIGDKYPNYFEQLDQLFALPFPVRYVHITRNPYDVVNSMLWRTKNAEANRDWWKAITAPKEMIEVWAKAFAAVQQFENDSRVLHIQYEDLIFDHENTATSVEQFLGLKINSDYDLERTKDRHFTRESLTDEAKDSLREHPMVNQYRTFLNTTGVGTESLKHLPT